MAEPRVVCRIYDSSMANFVQTALIRMSRQSSNP